MHLTKLIFILQLYLLHVTHALNILAIFPYEGKSHFFVFEVYLRELANRGHNVTVVSHFPLKDAPNNYRDISLAETTTAVQDFMPIDKSYWGIFKTVLLLLNKGTSSCKTVLSNTEFQHLLSQNPEFDVIVVEQFNSDCALGIAHHLKAPVVAISTSVMMPWHYKRLGITYNPSYMPFHFLGGGTKPTFYQRVERAVFEFSFNWAYYLISQRTDQNTLAKYFSDIPPLEELAREIKFTLLYHNFMLTQTRLLPSNVIEVGGFHVSSPKPLTGDLKKFIEEAEHGVIFISFGSVANLTTLPPGKLESISEAIAEFPQRFIWKLKSDKESISNIHKDKLLISDWLPQVDILAHPKTVAFFSHSGLLSTTEAIHYGVPIVAMPIFGEQPCNAASIEESGLGVQIQINNLTKDNIVHSLKTVLHPKFREGVKRLSKAWHDRPLSSLDTAVYWTEFTARHPFYTYRSASADVPLYQILCLDILSVIILLPVLLISILRLFFFGTITKTIEKSKKKSKRD